MKKILTIFLFSLFLGKIIYSQTTGNTGKPIAEIFTDFHFNLNDTAKTTGFGLNRAHLGYNYLPGGNFSATIIVNIGSPEDLTLGSKHRRYAYFREASISWSKDNLNICFGITGTRLFDFQQKFWGKRYIANTYQSINGYGFVADLGVAMDYKFNDFLRADFTIMNGEGYSELQLDNNVKTSAGLTITPAKQLAIRLYGDVTRQQGILQYTLIGFAGFKNELITIGAEASYKSNLDMIAGHHAWGLSGTGAISISKKAEIFVRCDYSSSVIVPDDIIQWNYKLDGSFSIIGVQYTFSQNVKMALNYQVTHPNNTGRQIADAIFLNALFRF
jgi:opacity protein-like surface antigen